MVKVFYKIYNWLNMKIIKSITRLDRIILIPHREDSHINQDLDVSLALNTMLCLHHYDLTQWNLM